MFSNFVFHLGPNVAKIAVVVALISFQSEADWLLRRKMCVSAEEAGSFFFASSFLVAKCFMFQKNKVTMKHNSGV